ncbi:hypothetical protein DUNSADRAFT_2744 [Dunaliella salina]|uniref:Secreted protein n=1 Tax=Dunaliella salina TaxID=3046 RepID=A0ABQ7FW13_DUNSA|nr:hypothetical protein DUNSADRAFT_2744 [Dunaliella salina]|eukprot:KAF5826559.1 hypothetical protein DUNSADRAFT_2744 [Dunaliella salina]
MSMAMLKACALLLTPVALATGSLNMHMESTSGHSWPSTFSTGGCKEDNNMPNWQICSTGKNHGQTMRSSHDPDCMRIVSPGPPLLAA